MTESEFSILAAHIHDARKPLNRISMQAELVKMALNGDVPAEKAMDALDKIIASTKACSESLTTMMSELDDSKTD